MVTYIVNNKWLIGFIDGEGCFSIGFRMKKSISVEFSFSLTQHEKKILEKVKSFLKCGKIQKRKHGYCYRIRSHKDLEKYLVPLIKKNKLKTKKKNDYKIWKNCFFKYNARKRKRYTLDFIKEMAEAREKMNSKGDLLKFSSKNIIERFKNVNQKV